MAKFEIKLDWGATACAHHADWLASEEPLIKPNVNPTQPSHEGMISVAVFNDQNRAQAREMPDMDHTSVIRGNHQGSGAGAQHKAVIP